MYILLCKPMYILVLGLWKVGTNKNTHS